MRKYLQYIYLIKDSYQEYKKNYKSIRKKQISSKIVDKTLTRHFTKEYIQVANNHMKR